MEHYLKMLRMNLQELALLTKECPNELNSMAFKLMFENLDKFIPACLEVVKLAEADFKKNDLNRRAKEWAKSHPKEQ